MRVEARVVEVPRQGAFAAAMKHAAALRADGLNLIYLSVARPVEEVRAKLGDGAAMHVVDATGSRGHGVAFGPDVFYVDSPVKLEKMAMVLRRLTTRHDRPHVVVDSLNGIRDYNGVPATLEFAHFLCNQATAGGVPIDLVVHDDEAGRRLMARVRQFADAHVQVATKDKEEEQEARP